ncbi:hypothetical protein [Gracilibacillus xinjiangensis]|uniref:Uncharacterized protein n=1 Tax=Gracilibacillus xinjiangensis TaxID=1193282 RepID=A0ABV8WWZ0_9BACI
MALSTIMFGMVVFILLVFIVIPVIIVNTFGNGSPPLKLSYAAFALLIIQWILYIGGFYELLPVSLSEVLFIPIWFVICGYCTIAIGLELKNNPTVSFVLAGLMGISFIFAVFLSGLGQM